jgi:GTP-binding protein Era
VVEEFTESEERYHIRAIINVMRDSQKGIIIGNKGAALKRTESQARLDMEEFLKRKFSLNSMYRSIRLALK